MKTDKRKDGVVKFLGADIPDEIYNKVGEIAKRKSDELNVRFTMSDVVRAALKEYVEKN